MACDDAFIGQTRTEADFFAHSKHARRPDSGAGSLLLSAEYLTSINNSRW